MISCDRVNFPFLQGLPQDCLIASIAQRRRHHKFRTFEVRPLGIALGKCEVLNKRFDVDSHAPSPCGKSTLKRLCTTEMHDVCRSSSHFCEGHQVMNSICFDLRRTALMMLRRIGFSCSKKFARFFGDKCFILAVRRDDHAEFLCQSQRAIKLAVVDAKCAFVCKENLE